MFHTVTDHIVSPDQSAAGPSTGHMSTPQYLPQYLLGDPTYVATSPVHSHRLWSTNLGDSFSPSKSRTSLSTNQNHPTDQLLLTSSPSRFGRSSMSDKHGGPPTQGIFDQIHPGFTTQQSASASFSARSDSADTSSVLMETTSPVNPGSRVNKSILNQSGLGVSKSSPAQMDPFYTQGESLKADDELDETWVTIFGFQPSAVSFILQQFSQYGNILEHKMSGCNNWVHIHYQSKIQARKALGKNGKIFCGNMMIGVTQCIDKVAMNESSKENVSCSSPLSFTPSAEASFDQTKKVPLGIRSLTSAYQTAASEYQVSPTSRTPQKKGGVVNKAMEYVFGW